MAEIHELQPVDLREVWPHEAWNFTPWLAERLHVLGKELSLELQLERTEAPLRPGGFVDILAKQAGSGANVVIENQLEWSDDSHCLRLLGYAANAGADILIWVAKDFTEYHRSIVAWLNQSDNINVYAVKVLAYCVGDALAADFELVVGPTEAPPESTSPSAANTNTWYANFYRPMVEQLRREGLPPVGRGGFRGQWRSFETGCAGVIYVTQLSEGEAHAFLQAYGEDGREVYQALERHKAVIDARLDGEKVWGGDEDGTRWLGVKMEAALADVDKDPEPMRQWLAKNLLRLRETVQPYLDEALEEPDGERDTDAEQPE